jgi:hypothetical protein
MFRGSLQTVCKVVSITFSQILSNVNKKMAFEDLFLEREIGLKMTGW